MKMELFIQKYNSMKKIITTILLALTIWSCGTRKVDLNKSKSVSEKKTDSVSSESKTENKEIEIKTNIEKWTENIEPIDTSKAIVIIDLFGKKTTLKNARIKREKIIDKSEVKEKVSKSENKKIQVKSIESKSEIKKEKKIEKTYSWMNILWILIPIGLSVLLWKNKSRIVKWYSGIWWV